MSEKIIALGLDRGFGSTKYYTDLDSGMIESLVAPISGERAKELILNNKDDENLIIVKYEDQHFLVGEYVALVEPTHAKRNLTRNREHINETILFLTGIGLATASINTGSIVVTTGLPADDYDNIKNSYKEKILNHDKPYVFTLFRGNKRINKSLKVVKASIENQPKGTIIAVINDKLKNNMSWQDLKDRRFAVSDIGFNTTDNSIYVGKDIVSGEKYNFSTFATEQIVKSAKKLIEKTFGCKKTEDEVLQSLKTGKVKIRGNWVDCSEEIKKAFEENSSLLVSEIASTWEDILDSFDEFILTGGNLENKVFSDMIKKHYKDIVNWEITVPENPQMSNSFGFYLISASIVQGL